MLENRTFPVRRTSRSRLREVDFQFEGYELRGSNRTLKQLPLGKIGLGRKEGYAFSELGTRNQLVAF
jgi:hypothetical protein